MGDSSEAFWRHRESSAAIWIAPYLDGEPDSTIVATVGGAVVGYLTGCVDTERFEGPDAVMMRQIMRHWLLYRPGVAGFLWRAMLDRVRDRWRGHEAISGELHDPRWPSHLHINLVPEARGAGLGRALVERWFERLTAAGSPGCHLGVIAENRRAVGFFNAVGVEPRGAPTPIPGMRGRRGASGRRGVGGLHRAPGILGRGIDPPARGHPPGAARRRAGRGRRHPDGSSDWPSRKPAAGVAPRGTAGRSDRPERLRSERRPAVGIADRAAHGEEVRDAGRPRQRRIAVARRDASARAVHPQRGRTGRAPQAGFASRTSRSS